MELSRPEYWSGWPFPSPGELPNPGIKPRSLALQEDSLPAEPQGKPGSVCVCVCVCIILTKLWIPRVCPKYIRVVQALKIN